MQERLIDILAWVELKLPFLQVVQCRIPLVFNLPLFFIQVSTLLSPLLYKTSSPDFTNALHAAGPFIPISSILMEVVLSMALPIEFN